MSELKRDILIDHRRTELIACALAEAEHTLGPFADPQVVTRAAHAAEHVAQLLLLPLVREEILAANLEQECFIDDLTRLDNRRGFERTMALILGKPAAEDRPTTLAVYYFDNLKEINDSDGHAAGDAALKRIATILLQDLGAEFRPARFEGGDEFAVMRQETTAQIAFEQYQALQVRFAATGISMSVGMACHEPTAPATSSVNVTSLLLEQACNRQLTARLTPGSLVYDELER